MVTVLFTDINSNYDKLECDTWNINRNALNYKGINPIIAHPPCRLFSKMKAFTKAPAAEKELAYFALNHIQKHGGILEHPAGSDLWKIKNLPKGNNIDKFGGWTLCIDQKWFGHPGLKRTFLYIVGIKPNELPGYKITFEPPAIKNIKYLSTKQRSLTPIELCRYLISIIEKIKINKQINELQNEYRKH